MTNTYVLHGVEKKLAEASAQLRRYFRWKAAEVKNLLNGEVGGEIGELRKILYSLSRENGQVLLDFMEYHNWFQHLDRQARFVILNMIDTAIIRARVRNGWSPINDSLPDQTPKLFEICREKLKVDVPDNREDKP